MTTHTPHYTDTQLKQALAKMLPETLYIGDVTNLVYWHNRHPFDGLQCVLDTELLHLCWLLEQSFVWDSEEMIDYLKLLGRDTWECVHASWQQRVIALAKVKGIEIV